MTILEWAKANAKDGANFAELEELVERANPLNKVKSADDAHVFMLENPYFRSSLDGQIQKAINGHDEKFKANKLPDLIEAEREKIRQELNPEESEEQKEIRRLREEMERQKQEIETEKRRSQLIAKASELGISEEIAGSFSVYGEDAETKLQAVADFVKDSVKNGIENGIKEKFKGRTPPETGKPAGGNVMNREEFDTLGVQEKAAFMKGGGRVE
jgi:uncharacterized protein with von Willebrand factor type A (vWA) domain